MTASSVSMSNTSPSTGHFTWPPNYGREGTDKSPVERAKLGWKWSVAADANGIPIGWAIDGANRNDVEVLEPILDAIAITGLLEEIGTMSLDRSYDYPKIRAQLHSYG